MSTNNLGVPDFLETGYNLRQHLSEYLQLSISKLESQLPQSKEDLAALHPGAFDPENVNTFYEDEVGAAHLLELAAWHLSSSNYIADTLRLQEMFAKGIVLDFGGGIGTHALAAAGLPDVDHVCFVDLNPQNRDFVKERSKKLGVEKIISVYRDLDAVPYSKFDTLICLDVLEHLPDPASQLKSFYERLSNDSFALMNWYFFKGFHEEYPFHFDDPDMKIEFFKTLQSLFIEEFHPFLITTRAYKPIAVI